MNAREREAAERLEAWLFDSSATSPDADDISTILAAVRRHDRLASEGLTEAESHMIAGLIATAKREKAAIGPAVAKLQAQLADALQLRNLLLSDPPASREDIVLAVREETAREIVKRIE